jgi:LEA14-like dessication related protein
MTSKKTKYSLNTCPFVFQKSQVKSLCLKEIRSSLIDSNVLTFLKINNPDYLNSFVMQVDFDLSYSF